MGHGVQLQENDRVADGTGRWVVKRLDRWERKTVSRVSRPGRKSQLGSCGQANQRAHHGMRSQQVSLNTEDGLFTKEE